ncbi:MAG: hypothetical protein HKN85_05165 [Gammaproteobacteria bacterium]|nr:hypothetical protein [Gammaproteobacteria bacterium]
MRYAQGEEIPADQLASHASDEMLLLTAVLGVIIGCVLAYLGKLGKQQWMLVWGFGLVLMSLYMGVVTWSSMA